jgi:predicted TIM-barrel enzyme
VGRGHQAFLDVKRSGEEIAADAGKRMQQLAEASDEVANKTKRLEQVAAGVQGGSQEVLDFARKAAGYVGLSQEPVSTDKTP